MSEQEFMEIEPGTEHQMTEVEQSVADRMYAAINDFSNKSDRSLQAADFKMGLSDLGFCSERARRMLDSQVPEDRDALTAFIGTAIGDHMEQAWAKMFPGAIIQSEVELELHGETRVYRLPGHPDIIVPDEKLLLDGKTTFGLNVVRRTGPSRSQQYQRHTYGWAAWEKGMFGECEPEEVMVGNIWLDRGGVEKRPHVQIEPLDRSIVNEAGFWLDDVVYAYMHGEEARKEPPREMCAAVCGFYRVCRQHDTDVEGLIEEPLIVEAARLYREGKDMEKEGKKRADEAKAALDGIVGSTGEYTIRWIEVGSSEVAYTKKAYRRLDVKPIK